MLGKLFKYEFKATYRMFMLCWGILMLVTLMMRAAFAIDSTSVIVTIPRVVMSLSYGFILIGMVAVAYIVMIQRYYKNLLGDEGYLMNTLPVSPTKNIIVKMVTSGVWFIGSVAAAVFSVFILTVGTPTGQVLAEGFTEIWRLLSDADSTVIWIIIELVSIVLFSVIASMLQIYASIALGHLSGKHRVAMSFLAYIVLNIIMQFIGTACTLLFVIIGNSPEASFTNNPGYIHMLMWCSTLIEVLMSVAYFLICRHVLTKKLNLE